MHKDDKTAQALGWFSIGLGAAEVLMTRALTSFFGMEKRNGLVRAFGLREITAGIGLLTRPQPAPWYWARVGGDVMDLAALAAAMTKSNPKRGRVGAALAFVGAVTILDIVAAQKAGKGQAEDGEPQVERAITIGKSADELYQFWNQPQNLSRIMGHFADVTMPDAKHAHWSVNAPAGHTLTWDTEIVESRPGEMICWKSLEGTPIKHEGHLRFQAAPGGRGTEASLRLHFDPPGGAAGVTAAKLLGFVPGLLAQKALRRFKSLIETGEIPTLEHNPSGRGDGDTF